MHHFAYRVSNRLFHIIEAMKEKNKYLTLFLSTLKISSFTFGGGFVIVPLLKCKFVDDEGWIDEDEMMDLAAIAQSTPGSIAINASVIVGYHVGGILGALVSLLGTIIPPLVIISVISFFYKAFRDNYYVSIAMKALLAGVAAVIADVVFTMFLSIKKLKRVLPYVIMVLSFVAVRFFDINIIAIIFIAGLLGVLSFMKEDKK